MISFGLTITGADNQVDPKTLDELGQQYPFVEWGILFSKSRSGTPRYPDFAWREKFYWATNHENREYSLAAHLCGQSVAAFLASYDSFESEITMGFNTIQFNQFTEKNWMDIFDYAENDDGFHNVIVPFNDRTNVLLTGLLEEDVPGNLGILLDASGGRGVSYVGEGWPDIPEPFVSRFAVGFAGGLNETNIETAIESVQKKYECQEGEEFTTWFDLETGARDEHNEFDLGKVIRILEKVSKFGVGK